MASNIVVGGAVTGASAAMLVDSRVAKREWVEVVTEALCLIVGTRSVEMGVGLWNFRCWLWTRANCHLIHSVGERLSKRELDVWCIHHFH